MLSIKVVSSFCLAIFVIALAILTPSPAIVADLRIIHMNDLHGWVESHQGDEGAGGVAPTGSPSQNPARGKTVVVSSGRQGSGRLGQRGGIWGRFDPWGGSDNFIVQNTKHWFKILNNNSIGH